MFLPHILSEFFSHSFFAVFSIFSIFLVFMESNKPIPTSNNTTNTTTPTSSAIPNQEVNTSINHIDLLLPHNYSSSYPNVAPEAQIFPSHSHPNQGLHYQLNESHSHQVVFPPNYLVPSIPPAYRLLDDSSRILPTYLQQKWDPLVSKEARNRRRMARQMGSSACRTLEGSSASGSSSLPPATTETEDNNITTPDGKKLKFILRKELKKTDCAPLGRIVLPKKPSEVNLPPLSAREGIQLALREVESTTLWCFRYRYWPNNNSRMYLFENTGDYVKQNELHIGDNIILYKDEENQLYISFKKASVPISAPTNNEVERSHQGEPSKESFSRFGHSSSNEEDIWYEQACILLDEPTCTNDIIMNGSDDPQLEDSYCMDAHEGYDFREFEQLADFEDCDFSLYNEDDHLNPSNHGNDKNDKDKSGDDSPKVN